MIYSLDFSKQAFKDFTKISDPFYTNIKISIENLASNPRSHRYIKLKNRRGYRIRVGDCREIYHIVDAQLIIDVFAIGNRREIIIKSTNTF